MTKVKKHGDRKPTYGRWKWTDRRKKSAMKRIESLTPGMTWDQRILLNATDGLFPLTDEQKSIGGRGEDTPLSDEQMCLCKMNRDHICDFIFRYQATYADDPVAMKDLAEKIIAPYDELVASMRRDVPLKPYFGPRIQPPPFNVVAYERWKTQHQSQ